jgi:hypothetical protein
LDREGGRVTTVKRITDLTTYTSVLPYDSEMFGVYQPLLGWKSVRIANRFKEGFHRDKAGILDRLKREFSSQVEIAYDENDQISIRMKPGVASAGALRIYDSLLLELVSRRLPPYGERKPESWAAAITPDIVSALLSKDVAAAYATSYSQLRRGADPTSSVPTLATGVIARAAANLNLLTSALTAFEHQLRYESAVGGALLYLMQQKSFDTLSEIFYSDRDNADSANKLATMLQAEDGIDAYLNIDTLDPRNAEHLRAVALSPIAVVHLFREYFFELDTFLGTPQSHVWLSPGSSVELIEVHTRKSTTERTLSTTLETTLKSETSTTDQDEVSEAVKQENDQDTKLGASVTASYASIQATSSLDYSNSQKEAREITHKRMREQTTKLSSEIRRNVTSTFKMVTELTDVSSTKHVLANTTQNLINYELRRKMRQVGVQVQDIGTFLCWQTYVDDPGKELGLSTLIHIAKSPDLDDITHPEEIPLLQPFTQEQMVTIPFISVDGTDADNEGEVYKDGVEVDDSEWFGSLEKIQPDFAQRFVCPQANYQLADVEFDPEGKPVSVSRRGPITNAGDSASFVLHLDSADFQGQNSLQVRLVLHWAPLPSANDAITAKNNENLAAFTAQEKAAYEKAYIETVKDRVTVASKIQARPSEELREEERIVVYRTLIQEMLTSGISLPDARTRHVVAELINSIFDVDKMLYFVAPEWWQPRLHRSRQQLLETPDIKVGPAGGAAVAGGLRADAAIKKGLIKHLGSALTNAEPSIMSSSSVGWGDTNDPNRDNYYITDESEPARLGSSLGWLLQLDGDNMRNAFLNAPWVKAVIPIRPGREEAAINWLKGVEGMNGITDDAIYHSSDPNETDVNGQPLEGQKMIDVLMDLAEKIRRKYQAGIETGKYPKPSEVSDPALVDEENTVTATPIDRVYEHGFFPLEGSFRANVGDNYEIFDQWVEILPTDQSVPVPVAYDPATGRQIPVAS